MMGWDIDGGRAGTMAIDIEGAGSAQQSRGVRVQDWPQPHSTGIAWLTALHLRHLVADFVRPSFLHSELR